MQITKVIWLPDVVDKLEWKHQVTPGEVEEVLASKPRFRFAERGKQHGEHVYVALGRSES